MTDLPVEEREAMEAAWDAHAVRCRRIMVGYGGESSHHPTCKLFEGHEGGCSAETDPGGLGDRRPGA